MPGSAVCHAFGQLTDEAESLRRGATALRYWKPAPPCYHLRGDFRKWQFLHGGDVLRRSLRQLAPKRMLDRYRGFSLCRYS